MHRADPRTANGHCVSCEVPQFARNHYFTGKLLEARDFTDEQDFNLGKQRRHNQRLHGSGTVCGLKVKQHPNPACRDRYVVVEPGTAIDCCGREIVVDHEEMVDLRALLPADWFETANAVDENIDRSHRVEICARYAECGIEDIPVLFDDCADEGACEPNRILESHDFGVVVDPPRRGSGPVSASLDWRATLNAAGSMRMALDEPGGRVFVVTDKPVLAAFDAASAALIGTLPIEGTPLDVALSADGQTVYVALSNADGVVSVHGYPADLTAGDVTLDPKPQKATAARLAVDPAGRLWMATTNEGETVVSVWDDPSDERTLLNPLKLPGTMADAALAPDGSRLVLAVDQAANIVVVRRDGGGLKSDELTVDGKASALAMAQTTSGTELYVADGDAREVRAYAAQWTASEPLSALGDVLTLADEPVALASDPAGTWLHAFVTGNGGAVVPIETDRLVRGRPAAGAPELVGADPRQVVSSEDGRTIFAVFHGAEASAGGVAVLTATEVSCGIALDRTIDGCPECEGDCVVLATLADYVPGADIDDAAIDNLADRRILASTETLTEVVRCLVERGPGRRGPQGRPGRDGVDGRPGEGLDATYAHICKINWHHAGSTKIDVLRPRGLLVAFDLDVFDVDIHSTSFRVLRRSDNGCWCELDAQPSNDDPRGMLHGIVFEARCKLSNFAPPDKPGDPATRVNGVQFIPDQPFVPGAYRVEILGDLIRDADTGRGLDANHEPPWFPSAGYHTGDRVEGGTFHSFFTVTD